MADEMHHVLPDILVPGLDAVLVGTVVGKESARKGHYYADHTNRFWIRLHQAGLTPKVLRFEDDSVLPAFGLGLTDLNKTDVSSTDEYVVFDPADFERRISTAPPAWIVFNGLRASLEYASWKQLPEPSYGFQDWTVGDSLVYVVPNSSGNNWNDRVLRGRTTVEWWQDAGRHINETRQR
jgi:double-stranded uracil-DNA glycosylase